MKRPADLTRSGLPQQHQLPSSKWSEAGVQKMLGLARSFVSALAALGVAAYGCAALVTVADVIGRKISLPVQGVVDLVQLFVMAGAWLVMPYAFMTGAHVGVDFVVKSLPSVLRIPLQFFATAVALVLVGLMLWYGFETFNVRTAFGDRSQQLGIPVTWYWYPLLVGLTISLLGVCLEAVASWQEGARNE